MKMWVRFSDIEAVQRDAILIIKEAADKDGDPCLVFHLKSHTKQILPVKPCILGAALDAVLTALQTTEPVIDMRKIVAGIKMLLPAPISGEMSPHRPPINPPDDGDLLCL